MVAENDDEGLQTRPPEPDDLVKLCRELNVAGAKYIVIGGMAIIQAGFLRATEDIDLLIEASQENQERVRKAMMTLPDQAIREVRPDDLENYSVVRVGDEITIDLMAKACGLTYDDAKNDIVIKEIDAVKIPLASPELLWKLKQTMRAKDNLDLIFLKELLKK
ncbi:MAG: nucleotidyltransferase [Ignavibacteriales bacterium]|nr:nucleotidyltransferase [Ignavibacteriales bacterium]